MKTFIFLGLGIILSSNYSHASGYSKIFTLERTLNTNQVVYEVDLSNTDNPVHPYWIMLAEDGHTEELNRIEKSRAYGTEVIEQTPSELKFEIVSFRSHPISVKVDPETLTPYATMILSGGEKILNDVFLTATGGIFPKVIKIDISYQDVKNGPILKESIDPSLLQI